CALSPLMDKCSRERFRSSAPRKQYVPLHDEVDLMKNLLIAASVLMLSLSAQAAQDPEAVYARSCAVCHNGAIPTAPLKGDKAAWEPRLAKGTDALVQSVTNGLGAMPPRGLCMDCSAEDYQAV